MDKINHVFRCEPVYRKKSLTYYPIIIRLASLRPDSGVYTLMQLWNLIEYKRLNITIISYELN